MWNPFKRRVAPASAPVPTETSAATPWRFAVALLTDTGCVRSLNEDSGRILHLPGGKLLGVIADGMGGHQAGEVASQLTVEEVCRVYGAARGDCGDGLEAALQSANAVLFQMASQAEALKGMGTTCTAVAFCDGFAYLAHAGDSRLYLIRGGEMYQMTEDHTHVMELARRGLITPEQARNHPDRNVLHRALGRHPSLEVARWSEGHALLDEDRYVLCSDGLSGVLTDEEIRDAVVTREPATACSELIRQTLKRGAPDNVTVGIVAVYFDSEPAADLPPTREMKIPSSENGQEDLV